MPNRTDALRDHIATVEALRDIGIQPSDEWLQLRDRHAAYLALAVPLRDRLTAAIIDGTGDIECLRALTAAEQFAQTGMAANAHIEHAVLHRLRELYDGPAAYKAVAEMFEAAAKRFADSAAACDVDAAGESLVGTLDIPQSVEACTMR